jgi:hypothetical protein
LQTALIFLPLRRGLLRALARLLVGTLLLAQLMVSAHACPALFGGSAEPAAALSHDPCSDAGPVANNLCGEHCKSGKQGDRAAALAVPVAIRSFAWPVIAVAEAAAAPFDALPARVAQTAAPPPHTILHCVFRI